MADNKQENLFGSECRGENKYTPPSKELVDMLFTHYRKRGFPHINFTPEEQRQVFLELSIFHFESLIEGDTIHNNKIGTGLASSYHPHRFGVVCNKHRTAFQVFRNDQLLRKCLEKCVKMSKKVNDTKLRSMLSIFEGVQTASNFPPACAAAIYRHHIQGNEGVVWDMSCGFGGRLLGAIASGAVKTYYGTEPSTRTFQGLKQMVSDLSEYAREMKIELHQIGSEDFIAPEKVDLCYTSPPYFDTEKYAQESSQSFIKFSTHGDWLNNFIGKTMENCFASLKDDGTLIVNIANCNSFQDLENAFVRRTEQVGFRLIRTMKLELNAMPGQGKGRRIRTEGDLQKFEPVFVFKKAGAL